MKKAIILFGCTLVVLFAVATVFFLKGTGSRQTDPASAPEEASALETNDTSPGQPGSEAPPAAAETEIAVSSADPAKPSAAQDKPVTDPADASGSGVPSSESSSTDAPAPDAPASEASVSGTDEAPTEGQGTSAPAPGRSETRLVFTGDVELSDSVRGKYDAGGISGVVSDRLHKVLYDADVLMINHEFCFSLRGEKQDKQFTFRVDPAYVRLLTDMGVDIAGLANNHVMDYGKTALVDTFATLTDAGIDFTGSGNTLEEASKLVVKTAADGRKIGFLAAGHVIPTVDWNIMVAQPGEFCFYDETALLAAIEAAKKEVDLLYVMVHWGLERTITPTDYQVIDGRKFIDAGADAVIGMHSHCLQPVEIYNGKPIFYSLGNFVFNRSIGSGGGGCVEVIIPNNEAPRYRIIPTYAADALTDIDDNGFGYMERISNGVRVDPEGNVTPASAE